MYISMLSVLSFNNTIKNLFCGIFWRIQNQMEYIFGIILICLISLIFYNNFKKKEIRENVIKKKKVNWKPKPLVDEEKLKTSLQNNNSPVIVCSKIGKWINVDGKRLLNFASHNYLNLIENDYVNTRAKNAIYKYGVGSCGPRGFYGTVDVHLELESHLANFMKTDRAIVYSYGFTTISSAIAAYVKKNDVVFADEKVNFAIQRGIEASRCKIFFFKHNDLADLERLLINFNSLVQDEKNNEYRSETKKFLIIEGIYMNSGRICPLPQLIEMRKRYKLRLLLDESVSFGVLGKNGRGVVEHFEANNEDVDMIMASMEYALGTGGGFCVGSAFIVEHQRLSGLGYCFSASLPPFLAAAACAGIDVIQNENHRISKLSECCAKLHSSLSQSTILKNNFLLECDAPSPVKYLILKKAKRINTDDEKLNILNKIILYCKNNGIFITIANYLIPKEHVKPPVSLRLTVNVEMRDEDIMYLIRVMEDATITVLSRL